MPPRTDLALFVDLECTGNQDDDDIIEIGVVAVSLPDIVEIDAFSVVVEPSPDAWARMEDNEVVWKMHTINGLIRDVSEGFGRHPASVDEMLNGWIDGLVKRDKTHIPFAGSGVLWFDRKYIKKQLPKFNKRITHWAYDMSVQRRIFQLAGKNWIKDTGKSHRAIDDARGHANELRFVLDRLRSLQD